MQRAEARRRRCVLARFVTVTMVNQTNQVMAYIVYVCSVFSLPLHLRFLSPTKHRPCASRLGTWMPRVGLRGAKIHRLSNKLAI